MRTHVALIGLLGCGGLLGLTMGGGCERVVDPQAEQTFRAKLGNTSVTVFPVFVRDGEQKKYDASAAKQIGDHLTSAELARVTLSSAEVPITSAWGMNQARMFRDSVADFRTYLKDHPIDTEYALLPEYLIGSRGVVVGVHAYLLEASGPCAYAIGLNSHHKPFNDVNPKTAEDCTTIVINVLRAELKPAGRGD